MDANPNKRTETRFAAALGKLSEKIKKAISAASTPQGALALLASYSRMSEFREWCEGLALSMVTQVNEGVHETWRQAARKAGRGSEIYARILQDLKSPMGGVFSSLVRENASLIQTFPLDVSEALNSYVAQETLRGRRSGDILGDLLKMYPDTAKTRLRLIARTEASKAQTALVQSRAQSLGLGWYVWRTSKDARVRSSHSHMDGVLVRWDDPPSPEALDPRGGAEPYGKYHAGDTFNCRCYPEPVASVDFVDFPAKAHYNGAISRITRAQFLRIS